MNSNLLEQLIIKACLQDTGLIATLSSTFEKDYFDNLTASQIYNYIITKFKQYQTIPPRVEIIAEIDKENDNAEAFIRDVDSIDYDITRNYTSLFDSINDYLKEKAVKKSILTSVDVINNKPDEISSIKGIIEEALSKDLKIDLGLDYFGALKDRLIRIMSTDVTRVPSYFPKFDEYISGGFPPYTLSIMLARIHGFKCIYGDGIITIMDSKNFIKKIKISDLYKHSCIDECKQQNNFEQKPKLLLFQRKYGEIEGEKRYNEWQNINKKG